MLKTANADIDRVFDYEIPLELISSMEVGVRVSVPFGPKNTRTEGYVVGFSDSPGVDENKIKMVIGVLDRYPVFSEETIRLSRWMKKKYYTTLTQCLQTVMPAGVGIRNEVRLIGFNVPKEELENEKSRLKLMESRIGQLFVIEFIEKFGPSEASEIKRRLKISDSPIKTLIKRGILKEEIKQKRRPVFNSVKTEQKKIELTKEQNFALEAVNAPSDKPVLIHGVTGSGKTEIYLKAIENVISKGKEAIVLVPEISLTPQLSQRFFERFGNAAAINHSRMSPGERIEVWQKAKNKEISIVIGPRSAVFAPFENIGIIIIDEEHEGSYISENTPKYDAREVAEYRCRNGGKVVYGTATPSIKTYTRALNGEIDLVKLKNRPFNREMPVTEIVDMRQELAFGNRSIFSRRLYDEIKYNLERNMQTILFINRRGYSTFISCRKCGHVMMCKRCNVSYTYHSHDNILRCHYCGQTASVPEICPECGSKYIKYFGTGTQKVEEEVKRFFPSAVVLRMDMDTTSKKNSHRDILSEFGKGNADILIGTQMIAKGHDFPKVTLVGVIAADISLNTGDYRSGETTFQLITQVSGRAGRDMLAGKVVIQTYNPDNYIINLAAKSDYESFYEKEIAIRKTMGYPPFTNLFSALIFGERENEVIDEANRLSYILEKNNGDEKFMILGPSPAVISKINDEYRWRIFIKGNDENDLRDFVVNCVNEHRKGRCRRVTVNISLNPQSIV
ncbi:primosomal protein N' [Anaerotignum faecicola]|nr:primosomal protein N' [Anaerotignum faecicola]